MPKSNEEKLLAAGYTLIRTRDTYPVDPRVPNIPRYDIWHCKGTVRHWSILEKEFKSKAARERRLAELLEDDKILKW